MQQREQAGKVALAASDRRAAYRAPDAALLELVHAGNTAAYDILYTRHVDAARRLASIMVTPAEADHVIAEAFAEVRDATLLGHGPSDGFRPYLLSVLRRVSAGVLRTEVPAETLELPGPARPASTGPASTRPASTGPASTRPASTGPASTSPASTRPVSDPEVAGQGTSPIVQAFRSLPDRWIAVLWHTQIEETSAADITRILGIGVIGVAALRSRALEGLRQAYLQVHMSQVANPECQHAARRLAAFFWDTASRRDKAIVTKHLGRCDQCRAMYAEFTDIEAALRSVVAPALLGTAAVSYMRAAHEAAASSGTTAGAAGQPEAAASASSDAEVSAAAETRSLRPASRPRPVSRGRWRWLGAGAVAVLAVATGMVLILAGQDSSLRPAQHGQRLGAAAAPPAPAITAQPPAAPPTPTAPPSPSPAPAGTSPAVAAPSPAAALAAPPPPAPAKLTATVDVRPSDTGGSDQVMFTVADTGGTATGELTVSLNMPGSSLATGGSGSSQGSGDGWSCHQTQSGATCQHGGIQAGSRAEDSLLISISNPQQACGRTVGLTAASGTVSDSAQSPESIQCPRQPGRSS